LSLRLTLAATSLTNVCFHHAELSELVHQSDIEPASDTGSEFSD